MTTWTPTNVGGTTNQNSSYCFYGALNGNQLTVYAEKKAGQKRQPQSKRAINQATIEQILSGELKPVEGRKHFDVSSLNDPACPYQAAYVAACEKLGLPVTQPA